jgi:2-keto-4-pentenoate hydratase/2-oxohepta-3-ene-1,7-dioic acid hydratase in catechol pathway
MKIGRIERSGQAHLAAVEERDGAAVALDLTAAASAAGLVQSGNFDSMISFIEGGASSLDEAAYLIGRAALEDDRLWTPLHGVRWLVPVERPSSFLCAGRNFYKHRDESAQSWSKEGVQVGDTPIPTGFVKLWATLIGDGDEIVTPPDVRELDYEVEIAAVMGRPALNVPQDRALDHVFGYTVFNDISAREWQRQEMRNQMLMLGKNFPTFGPLGPWILTADQVEDPSQLELELRVNGDLRQQDTAASMIFGFERLVSFWSKAGLRAGDLIASGTPDGVATHHKPDPFEWYLRPGDRIEATVRQIGTLRSVVR